MIFSVIADDRIVAQTIAIFSLIIGGCGATPVPADMRIAREIVYTVDSPSHSF